MKEVIIDGKKYFQREQSDIDKLPRQNHDKDMLKPKLRSEVFDDSLKYAFDECLESVRKASEINQDEAKK